MPVELCLIVARRFDAKGACGGVEGVVDQQVNAEAGKVGFFIRRMHAVGI